MTVAVPETIYDSVMYQSSYGTLKLSEESLTFHTDEKISVLPWKKVVRRQVTSASSNVAKPMFKLILKSGNEAVFQMEDRVSLEVLRDDLGERLRMWRKLHPETQQEQPEAAAINKTKSTVSGRRQSTPYRMVSQSQPEVKENLKQQQRQRRRATTMPYATQYTPSNTPSKPVEHVHFTGNMDDSTSSTMDSSFSSINSNSQSTVGPSARSQRRASYRAEQAAKTKPARRRNARPDVESSVRSAPDVLQRMRRASGTKPATTKPATTAKKAPPKVKSTGTLKGRRATVSAPIMRQNTDETQKKSNRRRTSTVL